MPTAARTAVAAGAAPPKWTAVRSAWSSQVVVAARGGDNTPDSARGFGGAGGGAIGTAGGDGNGNGGGGGGTQSAGGTAGLGDLVGNVGSAGQGGDGVAGTDAGSGGGGGGWFGGGSGGADEGGSSGAGGSGGGSGFGPPGTFYETGGTPLAGTVIISYDLDAGPCSSGPGGTPGTPADGLTPAGAALPLTAAPRFTG